MNCTICAGGSCRRSGSGATWENLLTAFGVTLEVEKVTSASNSYPLCSSCHGHLIEVIGLRQELVRLEKQVAEKVEELQNLVRGSVGSYFELTAAQLRAQLLPLPAGGYGHEPDGAMASNYYHHQVQTPTGPTTQFLSSRPTLEPMQPTPTTTSSFPQSFQPVDLNQGQYFGLLSTSAPEPPLPQPEDGDADYSSESDSGESGGSGDDFDQSVDVHLEDDRHDDKVAPLPRQSPPKKRRYKGGGRPGKLTEAQKASMLAKRNATEVETFAPVVTTEDGRRFYEGHEIFTLPSGNLQCGTCKWTEKVDVRRHWERIKAVKIHIKGAHLGAYKCNDCGVNLACLKSLRGHQTRKACGKHRHPALHQCDGCSKMFTFLGNLLRHKKSLPCGDQSSTVIPVKVATPSIPTNDNSSSSKSTLKGGPFFPCAICGRPLQRYRLQEHGWTHLSVQEKAEATAAGKIPPSKQQSQCPDCGKMVTTAYFSIHLNTHKEKEDQVKVQCKVEGCGLFFTNRILLTQHARRVHVQGQSFTCPDLKCKRKLGTQQALANHIRRVHRKYNKSFRCEICNSGHSTRSDLTFHVKTLHQKQKHTPEMFRHPCPVSEEDGCGVNFCLETSLKRHITKKHPELKGGEQKTRTEKVVLDREEFSRIVKVCQTKGQTKRPMQARESLPPFQKTGNGRKLIFLGYTVLKKKDGFICETCGKEFNWGDNGDEEENEDDQGISEDVRRNRVATKIKRHIKAIHREDYKCEICGYISTSDTHPQLNLNQHRRHHIAKCSCPICDKPLLPRHLSAHTWTHRGIEELVGSINSGERPPSQMTIKNTPRTLLNPPFSSLIGWEQDDIPIKCDHCPKPISNDGDSRKETFPTPLSLFHHIREKHEDILIPKVSKGPQIQDDLNPTLQLSKLTPEIQNGTTILLLDGEMVAMFSDDGKILLVPKKS